MSELTHKAEVFDEPVELQGRNLWILSRLLAGAAAFLFLSFLFAFFYLRSLNNADMWRPAHVDSPQAYGAGVVLATVLSVGFAYAAARALRSGRETRWRRLGAGALLLGLAAVGIQFAEYATLDFGPTDGGYASVFLAWTGLFAVVVILAMYWLETLLAQSWRGRGDALLPASAEAFAFFWAFLTGTGVIAWVLLYLV